MFPNKHCQVRKMQDGILTCPGRPTDQGLPAHMRDCSAPRLARIRVLVHDSIRKKYAKVRRMRMDLHFVVRSPQIGILQNGDLRCHGNLLS